MAPLGGVERPRRVVRFARLIQRRVRAFQLAFGGIFALPWWPPSVMPGGPTAFWSGSGWPRRWSQSTRSVRVLAARCDLGDRCRIITTQPASGRLPRLQAPP